MQTNRRQFFFASAAGLALASATRAQAAPSERIRVGFIGLNGQGTGRLREFMKHADVTAAAVCDLDTRHLERAVALVEKTQSHKPEAYKDYRKLLERKDLDAVMIATPDHWHALPFVAACQAGRDVFVEKPLSFSIGEGRAMVTAAAKYGRVTQMGNHIHNDSPNYRRVVELIRAGGLGKIHRIYASIPTGHKGLGRPADTAPPAELDYDFWLGPAPKRPYNPNRSHFSYRYFWDYSGGAFIDFWCHYTDLAYWAMDLQDPLSVVATGGRWVADDNAETPDTFEATWLYPGNVMLTWNLHPNGRPGYEHMGASIVFEGTEATVVSNYSKYEVYAKGKLAPDFPKPAPSIPDSPGHIREFLNSIKTREKTTCNIEYSHRLNKGGLLGNIALRTGERIQWDGAKERITNSKAGQALVTRRYRKGWKLA